MADEVGADERGAPGSVVQFHHIGVPRFQKVSLDHADVSQVLAIDDDGSGSLSAVGREPVGRRTGRVDEEEVGGDARIAGQELNVPRGGEAIRIPRLCHQVADLDFERP